MKSIYQRIGWATADISWVAREVVRIELRSSGTRTGSQVERDCDWIVKDACFKLTIYEIDGQRLAGADFCQIWLRQGLSKWQCKQLLSPLSPSGDLRDVPEAQLAGIQQKLQQELKDAYIQQRKCGAREAEDANTRLGSWRRWMPTPRRRRMPSCNVEARAACARHFG